MQTKQGQKPVPPRLAISERAEAAKLALRKQFDATRPTATSMTPATARERPAYMTFSSGGGKGAETSRARMQGGHGFDNEGGAGVGVSFASLSSNSPALRSSAAHILASGGVTPSTSGKTPMSGMKSHPPSLERGKSFSRSFKKHPRPITVNSSVDEVRETVDKALHTTTKLKGMVGFGLELPEEVEGDISAKKTTVAVLERLSMPKEVKQKSPAASSPRGGRGPKMTPSPPLLKRAMTKSLLTSEGEGEGGASSSSGRNRRGRKDGGREGEGEGEGDFTPGPRQHHRTAHDDTARIIWDMGRTDPSMREKEKEREKEARKKARPPTKAQQRWQRVRKAIMSSTQKKKVWEAREHLDSIINNTASEREAREKKESEKDAPMPGQVGDLLKNVGVLNFLTKHSEFDSKIAEGRLALQVPVGKRSMNDAIHIRTMLRGLNIKVFESLSSFQLRDLCYNLGFIELEARTVVFNQGDDGDVFYVIVSGTCSVQVLNASTGMTNTVCEYGPGDSFGELALIRKAPRSATVITRDHCELVTIHRDDYEAVLKDIHEGELDEKKDFLRKLDLFRTCPDENLLNLAYVLQPRLYEKNRLILKQNEMSDYIFFIRRGGVRVVKEVDITRGPVEFSKMGEDSDEEEDIWVERKPPAARRKSISRGRRMSVLSLLMGDKWRRKRDARKKKEQLKETKLKHWTTRSQYTEGDSDEDEDVDGPMRSARRAELAPDSPLLGSGLFGSTSNSHAQSHIGGGHGGGSTSYFLEVGTLGPHQLFPELGSLNTHGKSCVSFIALMECEVLVCSKWDFFRRVDEVTERTFREMKSKLFTEVRDDRRLIRRFLDNICWERYKHAVMDEVMVERARTKGKPLRHLVGNGKGIGRPNQKKDGTLGLGDGFVAEPTINAATASMATLSRTSARTVFTSTAAATSSASVVLQPGAAEKLSKGADGVPICGPNGVLPIPRDRHQPKALDHVGRHRPAFSDRLADEILQSSHQTSASLYEKLYRMRVMKRIEGSTVDEFDFLNYDREAVRLAERHDGEETAH
eukprot:CAMPEP_0113904050 /NCGR_PEP_ID=MMETSP0780_2-20120614/22968_1 /TAXON_ID=652834 /ORGANISM="Palpitomonas bilix" /LENGTH=1035 /DNA_ID=CAMNT_0000897479 /DNA_START=328 /DNA_END=3435 /DNA_ORIENTATION=+ /assembly_acc=CAM_ASM_000599